MDRSLATKPTTTHSRTTPNDPVPATATCLKLIVYCLPVLAAMAVAVTVPASRGSDEPTRQWSRWIGRKRSASVGQGAPWYSQDLVLVVWAHLTPTLCPSCASTESELSPRGGRWRLKVEQPIRVQAKVALMSVSIQMLVTAEILTR